MKLEQWLAETDAGYSADMSGYSYIVYVETVESSRIPELWNLADYIVTSRAGDAVTLVRRTAGN